MSNLTLVFTGKARNGCDEAQARAKFGRVFSLSEKQLDNVFSKAPIPVKRNLSKGNAHAFVKKLWSMGWHSDVLMSGKLVYSTKALLSPPTRDVGPSASQKRVAEAIKSTRQGALESDIGSHPFNGTDVKGGTHLTRTIRSKKENIVLSVPGNWHEATDLNSEACIQSSCAESDVHLIVVPQKKSQVDIIDNIEKYANEMVLLASTRLDQGQVDVAPQAFDHPTLDCMYAELVGVLDGKNIRYLMSVFESDDNFYTLYIWGAEKIPASLKSLMLDIIKMTNVLS